MYFKIRDSQNSWNPVRNVLKYKGAPLNKLKKVLRTLENPPESDIIQVAVHMTAYHASSVGSVIHPVGDDGV